MTFSPFVPIPLYFIYAVAKDGKKAFQPSLDWRAANADDTSKSGIGKLFAVRLKMYNFKLSSENPHFESDLQKRTTSDETMSSL